MKESNPYAPPQVAELEASGNRCWHLHGDRLLVKNGATLPRVDLVSGLSEDQTSLVSCKHSCQYINPWTYLTLFIMGGIGLMCRYFFKLETITITAILIAVSILNRRFSALLGRGFQQSTIWFFTDAVRHRKKRIRGIIRGFIYILLVISFVTITLSSKLFSDSNSTFYALLIAIGFLFTTILWHALDNTKLKIRPSSHDWLQIQPLHPDALAYLENLEISEQATILAADLSKNRRVRTMYHHRMPLRLLLQANRNPLAALSLIVMKFLRSKHLERLAYDFTESVECSPETLSAGILQVRDQWQKHHPDWILVSATTLDAPMGDYVTEAITLTNTDLSATLILSHFVSRNTTRKIPCRAMLLSWIEGGEKVIATFDCPYLVLQDDHLSQRSNSSPPRFYEDHLRLIQQHSIHRPKDLEELKILLRKREEKTNALLEERKILSPVSH